MIFKQYQQVLDGTKTQTRRPVKPDECGVNQHGRTVPDWAFGNEIDAVYGATGYKKWQVYNTYAVQPGRGKKAVGRIRITKIRREKLGDISIDDIFAEGIFRVPEHKGWYTYKGGVDHISPLTAYFTLWNSIYGNGAWERMLYDEVWVLDFERSEA